MDNPLPNTAAVPDELGYGNATSASKSYVEFLTSFFRIHPMPKLTNPDVSEIFGPLNFENRQYFQKYDGTIELWSIVPLLDPARAITPSSEIDDPDDVVALDGLAALPPPPRPQEGVDNVFAAPFLHRGRKFAWFYVSHNGEWRLAIFEQTKEP